MRPLRYSINVTLDGCCDHRAIIADEELHRDAVENLAEDPCLTLKELLHLQTKPARAKAVKNIHFHLGLLLRLEDTLE